MQRGMRRPNTSSEEIAMKLRSDITTVGDLNAGPRALWRATGTMPNEFGRPITEPCW